MAAIDNDWLEPLKPEFRKPYYAKLYKTLQEEYQTHRIFPPADDIFAAFHLTPLHEVKVVILGQDPYHGEGQTSLFLLLLRTKSTKRLQRHWLPTAYSQ